MRILLPGLVVGCAAQQPAPSKPDSEDTDADDVVVSWCEEQTVLEDGELVDAWLADDDTLYVAATKPRMRAPDGSWSVDAGELRRPSRIDGHGDEVWALGYDAVYRRGDGSWTDMGLAVEGSLVSVHVLADRTVVVEELDAPCWDCTEPTEVRVHSWDGSWSTEQPFVGSAYGSAWLDDTLVIAGSDTLSTPDAPIPKPSMWIQDVAAGPSGTLVVVGDTVAIGTVSGVAENAPAIDGVGWHDAWVGGADDIWVAGHTYADGKGVVAHWDGAWTLVSDDVGLSRPMLAGRGDTVFLVGGHALERVLVGDASGFTVDFEALGPAGIDDLAVDPVAEAAWGAISWSGVLARHDGSWQGVVVPGVRRPRHIAAWDGRVLLPGSDVLQIWDGSELDVTEVDGFHHLALAVDDVFFTAGRRNTPDGKQVVVHRFDGDWTELDTSGLPAGAMPTAGWADAPDDVWLGLDVRPRGAVAHWDGQSWTIRADLTDGPEWMARMPDGKLYFTVNGRAKVYEDGVVSGVHVLPRMRAGHRLPDGTWFVAEWPEDSDAGYPLSRRDPDGTWSEILRAPHLVEVVGLGERVWAGEGGLAWSRQPCPTR